MTESGFVRCKLGPGRFCTRNSFDLPHLAVRPLGQRNSADPAEMAQGVESGRDLRSAIVLKSRLSVWACKSARPLYDPEFCQRTARALKTDIPQALLAKAIVVQ